MRKKTKKPQRKVAKRQPTVKRKVHSVQAHKAPIVEAAAPQSEPKLNIYRLMGIEDFKFPDSNFEDYRMRICLMDSRELDEHLDEMRLTKSPDRLTVLNRLERMYLEANPHERATARDGLESNENLSIAEQSARILDPDWRTTWAKKRKAELERSANSMADQATRIARRSLR